MKFQVGDYVELSRYGRRYIQRKHPFGYVLAVNALPAIKVKFEDVAEASDWFPPHWFLKAPGVKLDGFHTPTEA